MNAARCMRCDADLSEGKRYKIFEEFPRTTVGYWCRDCWRLMRRISRIKVGLTP